MAEILLARV